MSAGDRDGVRGFLFSRLFTAAVLDIPMATIFADRCLCALDRAALKACR